MSAPDIVLDTAGGTFGGAGRWHTELHAYLVSPPDSTVDGQRSSVDSGPSPVDARRSLVDRDRSGTDASGTVANARFRRSDSDTVDDVVASCLGGRPRSGGVRIIGGGRRLTPAWLLGRERLARGADLTVAPNNACFAWSGRERRVNAVNALHYLFPAEAHLLALMPAGWRAQIPVVRGLLRRADLVVVPCAAMADRVLYHVPSVRGRLVVRPHPVSPIEPVGPQGGRLADGEPMILVPVVPGPYKNLVPHLRMLVAAADRIGHPARIAVTALAGQLPLDLLRNPRVDTLGIMPHHALAAYWRGVTGVFYPSEVEAFGYPLAEARVYGVPVIAPDTEQAREIAGPALLGYVAGRPETLENALTRTAQPITPEPAAFDRRPYFDWLLRA